MKILHVDPETRFGGGERQVAGLLRHLTDLGHENLLAAPGEGMLARRLDPAYARLVPLSIRNDVDPRAAWRLTRLVAREQPDVVHFHTARAHKMAFWLPGSAARSVVTRRMDYPLRRGVRTRLLYDRRVAFVVAISSEVRRVLEDAGISPSRIRTIPSGVDLPQHGADALDAAARNAIRARHEAGPERVVFSVLAALERRKGHDVLLHALAQSARPVPVVCWICGEGSERASLEALAAELGLGDRVRFLGERSDVDAILGASDVAVLPSRAEGLGVAILEAMAAELPVIATRVGGIPDAVLDGETGLLVPVEDADRLSAAIDRLAADPAERRRLGRQGRERIVAEFTLRRSAERYDELYREIGRLPRRPA